MDTTTIIIYYAWLVTSLVLAGESFLYARQSIYDRTPEIVYLHGVRCFLYVITVCYIIAIHPMFYWLARGPGEMFVIVLIGIIPIFIRMEIKGYEVLNGLEE